MPASIVFALEVGEVKLDWLSAYGHAKNKQYRGFPSAAISDTPGPHPKFSPDNVRTPGETESATTFVNI